MLKEDLEDEAVAVLRLLSDSPSAQQRHEHKQTPSNTSGQNQSICISNEKDGQGRIPQRKKEVMAHAKWDEAVNAFHITRMRGKFFQSTGFTLKGEMYLYPEEALFLAERLLLLLLDVDDSILSFEALYQLVMHNVSTEVYMTYLKLRSLEFVCLRFESTLVGVHCFRNNEEVYRILKDHPSSSLLSRMVSFVVYPNKAGFSKVKARDGPPTAYVVISSSSKLFEGRLLLALLHEAAGVPIIIAVVSPSGHVALQEFTDALRSIEWLIGIRSGDSIENSSSAVQVEP